MSFNFEERKIKVDDIPGLPRKRIKDTVFRFNDLGNFVIEDVNFYSDTEARSLANFILDTLGPEEEE